MCLAADRVPDSARVDYWKLRAEIAEANAAFAGSLSAEQKRMLEVIRSKSTELKALGDSMTKACKAPRFDPSGEPVCGPEKPAKSK